MHCREQPVHYAPLQSRRDPDVTDRYAVFGNPIAHSKSPQIHTAYAEQTAQDLSYTALCPPLDGFSDAARAFFDNGGRGCNITAPFKLDAAAFADRIHASAERAGAINTLIRLDDGVIEGHNTDGVGLVRDLRDNIGVTLAGKTLLIIGAGGAVRGVLQPLLEAGPSQVVIANRTATKAVELALQFNDLGAVEGCGLDALSARPFDVIINATSSGIDGAVPTIPTDCVDGAMCYDMFYAATDTAFVRWCKQSGAKTACDGLGMLLEQAAESFSIWRGLRPDVPPVLSAIRAGNTPSSDSTGA